MPDETPAPPTLTLEDLVRGLAALDAQARTEAVRGLEGLGESARPAIPALLGVLSDQALSLRVAWALRAIDPAGAEGHLLGVVREQSAGGPARAGALHALRELEASSAEAVLALLEGLSDDAAEVREAARGAIHYHPQALDMIPPVLEMLRRGPPPGRESAAHVLGRLDYGEKPPPEVVPALIEAMKDPDAVVRREVLAGLFFLHDEAEPAVEAASGLLKDPEELVRAEAARLLQFHGRGRGVRRALREALADAALRVRVEAALALAYRPVGGYGDDPEGLQGVFLEGAKAEDPEIRRKALEGLPLVDLGPQTVSILAAALRDPDVPARKASALALLNVGLNRPTSLGAAIPALKAALEDAEVRDVAGQALQKIAPELAPPAATAPKEGLEAIGLQVVDRATDAEPPDWRRRIQSAEAELQAEAKAIAEAKAAAEKRADAEAKARAEAKILAGSEREVALETLAEGLRSSDPQVREDALKALRRIGSQEGKMPTDLPSLLEDGDETVRVLGAEALIQAGSRTPEVVRALAAGLGAQDRNVRCLAAGLLGELGPDAREAVPALTRCLGDRQPTVRLSAAAALGNVGPEARSCLPALRRLLAEEDEDFTRAASLEAMLQIGLEGERLPPEVLEVLRDIEAAPLVRTLALACISQLGQAAGPAAPVLEKVLKEGPGSLRTFAAATLVKLGQGGEEVVAALREGLREGQEERDSGQLHSAAFALARLGIDRPAVEPVLEEAQRSEDERLRKRAAEALAALRELTGAGPGAPPG